MGATARSRTQQSFKAAAKRIERLSTKLKKKNISGLRVIGEEIMLDVKASRPDRGVPVDKGTLRSSGRVEGPKNDEVELSFGSAAAPYALEQHESVHLRHTVGEARYLVRGVDRWQKNGASVRRAMNELTRAIEEVAQRRGKR